MKVLRNILILLLTLPMVCSCIYDYPEPNFGGTHLELTFIADTSKMVMYPDTLDITSESHDIRYVIKAFRMKSSGYFSREASTEFILTKDDINSPDSTMVVTLEEGYYKFVTFADYVLEGESADEQYNTSDFNDVSMIYEEYAGNTDTKRAYVGEQEIDVVRYGSILPIVSDTIRLAPLLTRYQIIATDLDEFIMDRAAAMKASKTKSTDDTYYGYDLDSLAVDLSKFKLKITYYPEILFTHIDLLNENNPIDGEYGVTYYSKISKIDSERALLGFDYVFIDKHQESIKLRVSVYDEEDNHITTIPIDIPVKKGENTEAKGEFLTYVGLENPDDNGVIINPDYDGEFIIPFN